MPEESPLIAPADLAAHTGDAEWCIIDCRFALNDPERGRRDYAISHIPNALYAHLDDDLSGRVTVGTTGRHPLPAPEAFGATLSGWGIDAAVNVVAYDDGDSSIAARPWWMLRWMGHRKVSVLDGGWAAWIAMGGSVTAEPGRRPPRSYRVRPEPDMLSSCADVEAIRGRSGCLLIDSRSAERFRGDAEPIDPVAGHIPGAINAPFAANLDANGQFLPAHELRSRFLGTLGEVDPSNAVFYCGSGVSAAHNILALEVGGIKGARLFAGSWSEWIADPERPVAIGGS